MKLLLCAQADNVQGDATSFLCCVKINLHLPHQRQTDVFLEA